MDDRGDEPHVSESGSPHARYAVLTIGEQVSAELIAVAYDWKAAAGRPRPMGGQSGLTAFGRDG